MLSYEEIEQGVSKMLHGILAKLEKEGLPADLPCDHACYRVESLERYGQMKTQFCHYGVLVAETIVSKRPISIIQLERPLEVLGKRIECLELPAPKEGSRYQEGWEHVEFVVPDLEDFISRYDHLPFNFKGMKKEINPELGLAIDSRHQVKFHPMSILEVIERERALGIEEV